MNPVSFLFRMVFRSITVQRYRFLSLVVTIATASTLLVVLSSLYLNAESQLAMELSGVPNMVVEPRKAVVEVTSLNISDVLAIKTNEHFWRNNIVNAVPVLVEDGEIEARKVRIAGVWFEKNVSVENESYTFGVLKFSGWNYSGEAPGRNSAVLGANLAGEFDGSDAIKIKVNGKDTELKIAGVLRTGSYWDDYLFVNLEELGNLTGRSGIDMILVSALIKPKDELAVKAELYGIESLTPDEFETWYCSPYASSVAYTIKEVIPHADVKIQRRVTEVQEGLIKASSSVFAAMFILTGGISLIAIFTSEKMYVESGMRFFGIMAAMGVSRQKLYLQVVAEIFTASLISTILTYFSSVYITGFVSRKALGMEFEALSEVLVLSVTVPLLISLIALAVLRRGMERDVVEILRV
jgi:putative ABC transport system permease protein